MHSFDIYGNFFFSRNECVVLDIPNEAMQAKLVLLGTKIFIIGHLNPHVKLVRSRLLFRGHFAEYQQIIAG